MPVTFPCPCGNTLRVNDDLAGRRVRCPTCQAAVAVPAAEPPPAFEVVDGPVNPPPPAARAKARPVAPPEFEAADDTPRPKRRPPEDDRDDADDRPRRNRPRRRAARGDDSRDAGGRVGGRQVLAIVAGVVMVLLGLANFLLARDQYKFGGLIFAIGGGLSIYRGLTDRGGDE